MDAGLTCAGTLSCKPRRAQIFNRIERLRLEGCKINGGGQAMFIVSDEDLPNKSDCSS